MSTIRSSNPRFEAPSKATEQRVNSILAKLSLEEKIDMLGGHAKQGSTIGNARAGIPEIKMADGPVGVHWFCKTSTAYPASIANAASWDPELVYRLGQALGRDARARGVHILLAPGVNIYRSALCGRNFEYLGEDPYLASMIVAAYIKGVQSQGVATTVKHYAVNNQEYDRHNVSSDLDERALHEVYLPAFKAAIEAGSGCVMTAYNLVNGVHCSEHDYLNNKVLRDEWGFDGLVMSDWVSTYSAEGAANGGLDLEMPVAKWLNREKLLPLVRQGKVSEKVIDDKVRRILRLAVCFGWIDHEQQDTSIPMDDVETGRVALEVARAGTVLLKNVNNALPLDRARLRRIAVVGPNAHPAVIGGGGSAYTQPTHMVSILDGIRAMVAEKVEIVHATGPVAAREFRAFASCVLETEQGQSGLQAEYFNNPALEGQPVLTRIDQRVDFWFAERPPVEQVTVQHYSVRWKGTITPSREGTYILYANAGDGGYRVWLDGRLLLDTWEAEQSGTRTTQMHLPGGTPLPLTVEFRKTRHWAQMHFGWENKDEIQREIDEAIAVVRGCDAAIVCTGFSQQTEGEGWDRSFAMQADLDRFVADVAKVNPRTIVVLCAGGNVDMSRWYEDVKGLVHAWYPGQEGGTAVAEVLFGAVNPSGRLPATFETRLEDRSSFDCYNDTDGDKRIALSDGIFGGYRHHDRTGVAPRFAFGFGLSYTTFSYSGLRLSATKMGLTEGLSVKFTVMNTGTRAGAEVAQVYVSDLECRVDRPVKELKGFSKVWLEAGESATVSVTLAPQAFSFYDDRKHAWVTEAGEFAVAVGSSASELKLFGQVWVGGGQAAVRPVAAKAKAPVKAKPVVKAKAAPAKSVPASKPAAKVKAPVKAKSAPKKAAAKPVRTVATKAVKKAARKVVKKVAKK